MPLNGLLIDDAWCEFLERHRFLVGVSLDGTRELHDANRVDAFGNGTFSRVMEAIRLLEKHRVDVNTLTVLTGNVCRSYRKVHQFYKKQNFRYQQAAATPPIWRPAPRRPRPRAWCRTKKLRKRLLIL